MTQTIQLKRGLNADFDNATLVSGEPAFVIDTGKLYIGDGNDEILINPDLGTAAFLDTGSSSGNVPVLNSDGKLDESIIPAIAITDVHVVDSESEMLTLLSAQIGDVAIRTDEDMVAYILRSLPISVLNNWVKLSTPSTGVIDGGTF